MKKPIPVSSSDQRGRPSDPRHAIRRVHQWLRTDVKESLEALLQGPGLEYDNAKSPLGDTNLTRNNTVTMPGIRCLRSSDNPIKQLKGKNRSKLDGHCSQCLITFKGRRGLGMHLAKSKTCSVATSSSLYNRSSALVQSGNPSPIVVPEPMVSESVQPSMPSESPDSQLNKRIHREEEAARLQNEVEVRLPVKWPAMKECARWNSFEASVLSQLPDCNKPWTVRLENLQKVVYSVGVDLFGCCQPSGNKPKKNRRQIEIAAIRADIRSLARAIKSADETQKSALDQEMEERKLARNRLRRAENGRKRRAERRKLRKNFYSNPFKTAKEMISPRVET